jgi:ribose/xylose/arabinose/galactoside ABC-type transport system permease subunit
MFRPVRFLIVVLLAFLAGVLFERSNTSDRCTAAGGRMDAGLCRGIS